MRILFYCFVSFFAFIVGNIQAQCLYAHYKLDGNCNDSKGTNDGTNNGVSFVSDRFGNPNSAGRFNKSQGDYINLPFSAFTLVNYSYSVWVKPATNPPNGAAYIYLSIGGVGGDQNMQIENNQDNYTLGYLTGFTLTAYNINGFFRGGAASGTLPNVGEWYHVVVTRDTNYFKVYVNGCLKATSNSTNGSLPYYGNSSQNATIGCRNNLSKFFDGDLDDIRIFNCALKETEITALYNNYKVMTASRDTVICPGKFKPFKIKAYGKFCTYKWIDIKNRSVVLNTDSQLTVTKGSSATYRVFNNIGDSATVVVKISNSIVLLPADTFYCAPFTRTLTLNTTDSCLWYNGSNSKSMFINKPGTYTLKVFDALGCEMRDTFRVQLKSPNKYDLGPDTIFCGTVRMVLKTGLKTGTFLWNDGSKSDSLMAKGPGKFFVITKDTSGCSYSDTINIGVKQIPKFSLGNDTVFCAAFTYQLAAPDSFISLNWNGGYFNQKTLTVNAPGTVILNVKHKNGCSSSDTINILQVNPKKITFSDTVFRCQGDTFIARLNNYKSYSWNNGSKDSVLSLNAEGQYIIMAKDWDGCLVKDTFYLKLKPKAMSKFSAAPGFVYMSNPVFKLKNQALNFDKIRYSYGDGNFSDSTDPYIKYTIPGTYKVIQFATNQYDCNDTSEMLLVVYDDFIALTPSAFSPNDDGTNDVFKPYLKGIISKDYKLVVFNRWGEMLFVSSDPNQGWNGTYKGEPVEQGVYLYIVEYRNAKQIFGTMSGTMTLLR